MAERALSSRVEEQCVRECRRTMCGYRQVAWYELTVGVPDWQIEPDAPDAVARSSGASGRTVWVARASGRLVDFFMSRRRARRMPRLARRISRGCAAARLAGGAGRGRWPRALISALLDDV